MFSHKCLTRGKAFTIQDGPDLPKPLAGHCQLYIAEGKVFIYGGITTNPVNTTEWFINTNYSNEAYMWSGDNWFKIPKENPCSNNGQDLAFQQSCAQRIKSDRIEVVVVTFNKKKACTSIINLLSNGWTRINGSDVKIPFGGHLVTSLDKSKVFYLGGIYYEPQEVQSYDVYELKPNDWQLTIAELPIAISSNLTKSYPSLHNVTLD